MHVAPHGIGLGLRQPLAKALFADAPSALTWLEIHPENYLERGGRYETLLADARARFPLVTHGLSMGFGSVAPCDAGYLRALRQLLNELGASWHSDHLCFAGVDGVFAHDLLPLPLNREAVSVVVDRIHETQDALGVDVAVEHISYYATPPGSTMKEIDFLNQVLERADAKLLLDVNNVYVNSCNHGFDPYAWIERLPLDRVVQLHVAGHFVRPDGFRIDTHAEPICEETFALLEYALTRLARPIGVLLERDDNYPEFSELALEIERLQGIYERALATCRVPDKLAANV
jgi:uncharacterized protein (UPF0276 family)